MNTYLYIAVMAVTTYLIRVLPLTLIRKPIRSTFLHSFLYYVPYAVLAVMTVPAIFSSTASLPSAIAGFAVALVLAFFERGLLTVAAASCAAVFIAELIINFIG